MDTYWVNTIEIVGTIIGILAVVCTLWNVPSGGWLLHRTRAQFVRLWNLVKDPHGYQRQIDELKAERRVFDTEARANMAAVQKNAEKVAFTALEASRKFAAAEERRKAIQEANDEVVTWIK